ncbi:MULTISPECIES: ATP-binding cassette domain-containing protein [Frankia]|uniref:Oligopeptide transport protein of the ABC superfamily, ATP-binding component n=1 Tax=Frankia alni (strain DSM 45986 / CECT 9034 / ACN14a) TaxID=326424 RepID=Q0RGB1_FRAAA|nr:MULTISPECIES: ABC transporter ATP-binding protein [Frankia]CAJ63477.1 oligopeptide transport protein of the ABC superfamily, ATP-binding component [Frankia alni ACN14a]
MTTGAAVLEVTDLRVRLGGVDVVDGVSFALAAGERVGLIGESGSGKSLTALAVLGLLPPGASVTGSVRLHGRELLGGSDRELSRLRGRDLAMIFQEPSTALNPLMRVGRQISEPLRLHRGYSRQAAARAAVELAAAVGLPDPQRLVRSYPHELSGGQRQRVCIAAALACRPAMLLADEPTTALDVTVQAEILALLGRLVDDTGTALLFITHDLAVVAAGTDRLAVLRRGRVVETGATDDVLRAPADPYTRALLAAARLTQGDLPAAGGGAVAPTARGSDVPTPASEATTTGTIA